MNKKELVAQVATEAGISGAAAARAIDATTAAIQKALKAGDDVTIIGFGTFKGKATAARTGRNPQTGAAIKIAAKKSVGFKAGKALKDALNG